MTRLIVWVAWSFVLATAASMLAVVLLGIAGNIAATIAHAWRNRHVRKAARSAPRTFHARRP